MHSPHVQLVLDENPVPQPLLVALNRLGARVSMRSLNKARQRGISPSADVCVILPSRNHATDLLDNIVEEANNQACATMIWPTDDETELEQSGTIPSSSKRPVPRNRFSPEELTGRLKALCDIRQPMQKMRAELEQLRRQDAQLRNDSRAITEQLKLASQVQQDLLPQQLDDLEPFILHTLFLPADHVSGDIYDIHRLDENQFGISLADATGHGVPAALLTILIKNSLRGDKKIDKEIYNLVEPATLLSQLNDNILSADFSQCQFITALNAILNRSTDTIRWARGGMPYPILLRPNQSPQQLRSDGGLLGAFPNQSYEPCFHRFESGDSLLFFSDGIESLLLGKKHCGQDGILHTPWLKELAHEDPDAALQNIRQLADHKKDDQWCKDDITIVLIRKN